MRNTTTVDFKTGRIIDDGSTTFGRFLDAVLPGRLGERWDNTSKSRQRQLVGIAAAALSFAAIVTPFDREIGSAPQKLSEPVPVGVFASDLAGAHIDDALRNAEGRIGSLAVRALQSPRNQKRVVAEIAGNNGVSLLPPYDVTAGSKYVLPELVVSNNNSLFGMAMGAPGYSSLKVEPVTPQK